MSQSSQSHRAAFAALIAFGLYAAAAPALAQEACARPAAPAAVDGAASTMEQLLAAKAQVAEFMAASDKYQSCVIDDVNARKAAAKAAKTKFDDGAAKTALTQVDENQAEKVRVGAAFNQAVKTYKAAHPS